MSRNNVAKMSSYSDSAHHWTPEECLEEALSEFDDPECDIDGLLVLRVRRGPEGFVVRPLISKLSRTEIVAACGIIKARMLETLV